MKEKIIIILLIAFSVFEAAKMIKYYLKSKTELIDDAFKPLYNALELKLISSDTVFDIVMGIIVVIATLISLARIFICFRTVDIQFYTYYSMYLIILNGIYNHLLLNFLYKNTEELTKEVIDNKIQIETLYNISYIVYDIFTTIFLIFKFF